MANKPEIPSDAHDKSEGAEKKKAPAHPEGESKEAKKNVAETRTKASETLRRSHEDNPEEREENSPYIEDAQDALSDAKDRAEANKMYAEAEKLNREHLYTVPHGASRAAATGAVLGGSAILASSWPTIWTKMVEAWNALKFKGTTPHGLLPPDAPSWVVNGAPFLASIPAAFAGWYLGGRIGKWVAKHTSLKEETGQRVGNVVGAGVAGTGAHVATGWILKNGFEHAATFGTVPTFSWLATIPGALIGAWAGGKLGEIIGKNVFGHPGAGRWIGRIAGGAGLGWATGAAGGTILGAWPGAVIAGVAGLGLWGTGRALQYALGWERKGVWGTIKDVPKGLLEGGTRILSWLGKKIAAPFRGVADAMEEKPASGEFLRDLTGRPLTAVKRVAKAPFDAIGGALNNTGIIKPKDLKKNRFPTKVGDTTASVLLSPVRAVKRLLSWLWRDKGGKADAHAGH